MKLLCISDCHGLMDYSNVLLPPADVLIHAGDFCNSGNLLDFISFSKHIKNLNYEHILLCPGNHDRCVETDFLLCKSFLSNNVHLLINGSITLNGLHFHCCAYQPFFNNWAFNVADSNERSKLFEKIPENTNVLITHCPPAGILDKLESGEHVGDIALKARIPMLPELKLNVFGHIHNKYGIKKTKKVTYVNASLCNERYELTNAPIVINI